MKFFEKGLIVDYIKGELMRTPIPTCKIWKPGMSVTKGVLYLYGNSLLRATKTVMLNEKGEYISSDDEAGAILETTEFLQYVRDYYWGDFIHGVTVKYESNASGWSRLDHYMLGLYLRWQKVLFGNDWLYGYNCWDGQYLSESLRERGYVALEDGIITLTAPVTRGSEYTIWGDSPIGTELALGYTDRGERIGDYYYHIASLPVLRRTEPQLIKIPALAGNAEAEGIDEYLTLLIQIPLESKGVFVAEGNYVSLGELHYGDDIERAIRLDIENARSWDIACLDRVVEGLLGHVINGGQYRQSVEWLQRAISSLEWHEATGTRYEGKYVTGVWDKRMQQWVRNTFGNEMKVNGVEMNGIKMLNGEGVKEIEKRIREVLGNDI